MLQTVRLFEQFPDVLAWYRDNKDRFAALFTGRKAETSKRRKTATGAGGE